MTELQYRRPDGSFVAIVNGLPYHIPEGHPMFEAAQELADELGDDLPFEPPPPEIDLGPFVPYLNNGGLARFTGTAPVVMLENIRVSSVSRISKGRYRVYHVTPYPTDQYSAVPSVFDALPRTIRLTARTATYVEVRVTDLAGTVQDPQEITITTERVVTG